MFGEANSTELWINEYRVRDRPAGDSIMLAIEKVRPHDSIVIVRDMGECRPALDITQGKYARYIGLKPRIDHDISGGVDLDARCPWLELVRVGSAPGRDQQVR